MADNIDDDSYITNMPFEAYEGDKDYIFISYKHADWKAVYPVIDKLHERGVNIWYDANLTKGKYYDIQIAKHIKNAALFVTFITERVMKCCDDEEDYLIKELNVAISTKRQRLPIFLDDVELDGFYLMHYTGKQSILKYQYGSNEEKFIDACISTFKNDFDVMITPPLNARKYIYACYAHKDLTLIESSIQKFEDAGFDVVYDPELSEISDSIKNSSLFVVFISPNSVESRATRTEIDFALKENIPILPIYIEETEIPFELSMGLSKFQAIPQYMMSEEEYVQRCLNAFEDNGLK